MTLAKVAERLNFQNRRSDGPALPPLLLMTDDVRLPDPLASLDALPRGCGVILRHYASLDRKALAIQLRAETRSRQQLLLIAEDVDLALAISADGLHLPDRAVSPLWHLKVKPHWFITAAAHSELSLRRAANAGVDAVLLSPVFPTRSHPDQAAIGALRFARLGRCAQAPVYALGGINDENAQMLARSGSIGIAGISGIAAASG